MTLIFFFCLCQCQYLELVEEEGEADEKRGETRDEHTDTAETKRKTNPQKQERVAGWKPDQRFTLEGIERVVLIPEYFILARCTGVCLSIMDAPKWPSISAYINKPNGEKCSPNRQQLVITVMLLSRHDKPWRRRRKENTQWERAGTDLDYRTSVIWQFSPEL